MRVAAIRDNKLLLDLKEFLASSGDATFGFVDFMAEVGAAVLVLVEPVQKVYQILILKSPGSWYIMELPL